MFPEDPFPKDPFPKDPTCSEESSRGASKLRTTKSDCFTIKPVILVSL